MRNNALIQLCSSHSCHFSAPLLCVRHDRQEPMLEESERRHRTRLRGGVTRQRANKTRPQRCGRVRNGVKKTNKLRENTVDNPFTHLTRAHSSRRHKTPPPHFAVEIYNWIKQPGDDYHLFFFLFGLLFPTKGSCTG